MLPIATLSIFELSEGYLFHFQPPARHRPAATLVARQVLPDKQQQALSKQISAAVHLLNRLLYQRTSAQGQPRASQPEQALADHLLSLGRLLYNQLLPAAIQQALAALPAPTPLSIITTAPDLPWELLHDGNNYLALTHWVARQLPVATLPRFPLPRQRTTATALLIGNPTQDLPQASTEIMELAELLTSTPAMVDPVVLLRTSATKTKVLRELAGGVHDLLHYSGHALFNPADPQTSGLLFANAELLTAAEIQQNLGGQPLVFLNGCESARNGAPNADASDPAAVGGALQGLATAFIQGGAVGFIGAFWPLYDQGAKAFALALHRCLLQGECVGAALHRVRNQLASAADPLWASYTFYGDPGFTLTTPEHPKVKPATVLAVRFPATEAPSSNPPTATTNRLTTAVTQLAETIQQHGGHLHSVIGDTLLALFGVPQTLENDALRAVSAALAIQKVTLPPAEPAAMATPRYSIRLSSGNLLWQAASADQPTAPLLIGDCVEQALHLTQQGDVATILITPAVAELTRSALALGEPFTLPGRRRGQSETVYQVYDLQAALQQPWQAPASATALIERSQEIATLTAIWQSCCQGRGQIVNIVGEAGVGKSRLLQAFHQHLGQEKCRWLYAATPALYRTAPYRFIGQLCQSLFALTPTDDGPTIQQKISTALQQALGARLTPADLAENVALLGELLALPLAAVALDHLDAPARRRRLVHLLGRLLVQSAQPMPLVVALEDLHWADEASLATLQQLVSGIEKVPLLIITLFRPTAAWQPPWGNQPNSHTLALAALSAAGTRELVATLLNSATVAAAIADIVHLRSNGNPFFIRAWVTTLVETKILHCPQGVWETTRPLTTVAAPGSVQRLLLARIAGLPSAAQRLLPLVAVIGAAFAYPLLQTILTESGESTLLEEGLALLANYGLIHQPLGEEGYQFTHALIQEVVYENLLPAERQRYHQRVGRALETAATRREAEDVELLAYHYQRSDQRCRAAFYGVRAAKRAATMWANQTALTWCDAVAEKLASFATAPLTEFEQVSGTTSDQIIQWTVDLWETKADVLAAMGHNDAAIAGYQAALQQLAAHPALPPRRQATLFRKIAMTHHNKGALAAAQSALEQGLACLRGEVCLEAGQIHIASGLLHYRRGHLEQALLACEQGIIVIKRTAGGQELAQAYNLQGIIYRNQGKSDKAIAAHQESITLYQQTNNRSGLERAVSNLACAYQDVGRWPEALTAFQESARLSEQMGDERRRAAAAINLGEIYGCQGQLAAAIAVNEQARQIGETFGFAEAVGIASMNLGYCYLRQGALAPAQSALQQSRELFVQIGVEIHLPEVLRYQALWHISAHDPQTGLTVAQQALDWATKLGRKLQSGQALRVLGQALGGLGRYAEADHHLRESLAILNVQNSPYEIGLTLLECALLYAAQAKADGGKVGLHQQALVYCDEAIALFDKVGAAFDRLRAQAVRQTLA